MLEPLSFIEKPLSGTEPARCVDGRQDPQSPEGPQMLGGSLHPIFLKSIVINSAIDELFIKSNLAVLREHGFKPGFHRGAHRNPETNISDCGAADRLSEILTTVLNRRKDIEQKLTQTYEANSMNPEAIGKAYEIIEKYNQDNIRIKGEELISTGENEAAGMENLQGDHQERVAFVNLKKDVTFDTRKANEQGWQAFNLDLNAVIEQAKVLGVGEDFAIPASLIFYLGTEIVLVENKGKEALPVVIYK